MNILLKSGKVYDPKNKIFGKKKDIFVTDGMITSKEKIKLQQLRLFLSP